jgi:ubiquinone/menaquinone biosynthesis C-methylase UbiE
LDGSQLAGTPAPIFNLLRGIHEFPDQKALRLELLGKGFEQVSFENLSLGIVALHRAVKPAT